MTILYSDNYTRTDSTGMGANWTSNSHDSSAAGFNIASNEAVAAGGSGDSSSYVNSVVWPADQYVEVTIGTPGTSSLGSGDGCACRMSTSANTFYRLIGSFFGWEFGKNIANTFTSIASSGTDTFATGDKLRLEMQGTAWRVYKTGVLLASGTDASIATGNAGIAYSSTDTATLTSFEGGSFSASTAPNLLYSQTGVFGPGGSLAFG